jgi:CheY-like chemotaxis protein
MTSVAHLVLIVEDEGLIRMSLAEDFEEAGFHVLEAGTADEALKVLETHPEIEAIFTDIDMPGSMNGLKLAESVHEGRPDIAIVLTSGFLKVAKNDLPRKIPFVAKPYDVSHVINHIQEMIFRPSEEDCFPQAIKP